MGIPGAVVRIDLRDAVKAVGGVNMEGGWGTQ